MFVYVPSYYSMWVYVPSYYRGEEDWCDLLTLYKLSVGQAPRLCNLRHKTKNNYSLPFVVRELIRGGVGLECPRGRIFR